MSKKKGKFDEPRSISNEDGEKYWLVRGHDRPTDELEKLSRECDCKMKARETWARIVPSGGNPDAKFYVADGDRYKDQRGAFPCTIYEEV